MPIHHSIDNDRQLSVTTITGLITVSEAADFLKMRAVNGKRSLLPLLVDAREAETHDFLITDMDLLARLAADIHGPRQARKEAFVAVDEHNVGLLTLFRKFSLNRENQRVFQEVEEAIRWLKTDGFMG